MLPYNQKDNEKMKNKKEHLGTIDPNRDIKPRVPLHNKTVVHKDKKKERDKKKCRKNS